MSHLCHNGNTVRDRAVVGSSHNEILQQERGWKMADSITADELKVLISSDRTPALFDVRRKTDFDVAPKKIEGAVRGDPEKIDEWIDQVPQDRPVVLYCVKGGSVSQGIAGRLQQSHPDVKFLQGGIKAWEELGEPLEE
jgi:rhodanese-related sulfurtransferase